MKKKLLGMLAGVFILPSIHAQVGIGTTAPTATLHVKTNNTYMMRIEDAANTASTNFIIQSADSNGNFTKVEKSALFRKTIIFTLPATGATITTAYSSTTAAWQNTGIPITVPPGKWNISGTIALIPSISQASVGNRAYNGRLTLADSSTSTSASPDLIAVYGSTTGGGNMFGRVVAPADKDFIIGNILINNSGSTDKIYYILANVERLGNSATANLSSFAASTIPENQLYALPVNDN